MDGQRTIIGVMVGGEEILLSVIRPSKMRVLPNEALNMNESPHLIISYLLRGEWEDLESKYYGRMAEIRG